MSRKLAKQYNTSNAMPLQYYIYLAIYMTRKDKKGNSMVRQKYVAYFPN